MTLSPLVKKLLPLLLSLAMVVALSVVVRSLARFATPPGGASRLADALPEVPNLSGWPSAFVERLKSAHAALADPRRQQAALRDLALLYHANGFLAEAQACYAQLGEMQPRDARWPYLEALARGDFGDQTSVIEKLRRSIELDPSYRLAYLKFGDAAMRAGNYEAAQDAYRKFSDVEPNDRWALVGLARASFALEQPGEAKRLLDQALDADPEFAPALELGAAMSYRNGDDASAAAFERRAADAPAPAASDDPRAAALDAYCYDAVRLAERAEDALRRGQAAEAAVLLERAAGLDPSAAEAFAALARLHARAGRMDEAFRVAAQGLEGSPESRELSEVLAELIQAARD